MNESAAEIVTAALTPTATDWARYKELLEQGVAADGPELLELCQRLAIGPDDIALHRVAIGEAKRLEQIAAGQPAAQDEVDRVAREWLRLREERNTFLAAWQTKWDAMAGEKGQAQASLGTCQHAASSLDCLKCFLPALFGLLEDFQPGDVTSYLPAAITNCLNEKRRAREKKSGAKPRT